MEATKRYDRAAPNWDLKLRRLGYVPAYRAFLARHVNANQRVLDMGTGTGVFAKAWISEGGSHDITVLDFSAPMLRIAVSRLNEAGVQAKAELSSVESFEPSRKYQTVLMAHVIEHCPNTFDAFSKVSECLTLGGRFILVASKPHWCNWLIWLRYRHRWFEQNTLCKMAHAAGLTCVETYLFRSGAPSRTSQGYVFQKTGME